MKKFLAILVLGLLLSSNAYALPNCEGDDYSKWTNCQETYIDKNGAEYVGEFSDSI